MRRIRKRIRKVLVVTALGLALFVTALLIRTALFDSRQIDVRPIERIVLDDDRAARHLSQALQFETVSHRDPARFDADAFLALRAFLERTFPKTHAALTREIIGGHCLLFEWAGSDADAKPILLMAHLDVVPVEPGTEDQWTHPPFAGRIADGFVWGRGAMDFKSGVMACLEAVELLVADGFEPARTVYLAFGHDEEIGGMRGAAQIAATLKERGVELLYVLDEGGAITDGIVEGVAQPVAIVSVAEKGVVNVELIVEHEGGHSSMPPPQTAVGVLAAAIHRLESDPFPADIRGATALMLDYIGPEMAFPRRFFLANRWLFGGLIARDLDDTPEGNAAVRTTTAATLIDGGVKENVLPRRAGAVVNFRILPGDSVAGVLAHVRATVDDPHVQVRVLEGAWEPSAVSDPDSASFTLLHRTISEVFPDVLVAPNLTPAGTDARHYAELAESTLRFFPQWLTPGDLKRIHGVDERISIEQYADIVRFYVRLIRNSAARS
jgi:carboxypeptidase PM20D1